MNGVVLYKSEQNSIDNVIQTPCIDGQYIKKYEEGMLEDSNNTKDTIDHILLNGYEVLKYLLDPTLDIKKTNKILCLGKVQSGKTSFFISAIALAFDNGYNVVVVLGGTKKILVGQNKNRIEHYSKKW